MRNLNVITRGFSLLFVATVFTFCTKEAPIPLTSDDKVAATERGICSVTVEAVNCGLEMCGTQTSTVLCGVNGSTAMNGTDFLKDGTSQTYVLATPTVIRASVDPGSWGPTSLVRVTVNGVTRLFPITGSPTQDLGAVDIRVNDDCSFQ